MKICKKCQVKINTERKTCPLCLGILTSLDDQVYENQYPKPSFVPEKRNIFIRILSFLTILAILASILINIATYHQTKTLWSLIVIIGIGYFWILLKSTFRRKTNVPLRLVIQMVALSAVTIVIDKVSGNIGWSLNYVIPFLSMASLLSIISLLIGNRVKYSEYLLYLLASVIFGIIPFLLWIFQIVSILWPSLSAASLSVATLIGMIVFADVETKEEIKKRFHI